MKSKAKIAMTLGALIAILFVVRFALTNPGDPAVSAVVARLPKPGSPVGSAAPARSTASPGSPESAAPSSHTVSVAPASALANAISLSSYFAPSDVAGLSAEQLAALETTLDLARRATYGLLLDRATIAAQGDGGFKIEIPAQGDALNDMREYVIESIAAIVGEDQMKSLQPSLGPKFDAHFAYFGEYTTTIELALDRAAGAPTALQYVTMRNGYENVRFFGFSRGRISATHVLRADQFSKNFFPLDGLKPQP